MKRDKMKQLSQNATFAGIIGALVGAIAAFVLGFIATEVKYHDAVTYNNISSYIDSLLVKPGMIDGDILLLDNPFEQINMIAETMIDRQETAINTMNDQQSNYDNIITNIRECLINTGKNKDLVDKYTQDELLNELEDTIKSISSISEENEILATKLEDLKEQKTATLSSPDLKILGEDIDTTLTDYKASIDGHNYYSESLLNSFLPEKITYVDEIIKYGEDVPEKINVVSAGLIYDDSYFSFYNGGSHFTMSLQNYTTGITNLDYRTGVVSIACNGDYSQLSFTLGHVDNSGSSSKPLTISYLDTDGNYKETYSVQMYSDMPVELITVPIYNTKTVKITIPYTGDSTRYGLADLYLIK